MNTTTAKCGHPTPAQGAPPVPLANLAQCELCEAQAEELIVDGGIAICEDCLNDIDEAEADADQDWLLEQQELEDFEQADEYFGDGGQAYQSTR